MQVDRNDDADRRASQGSDPGGDSGSPSQPLAGRRLTDKLQKLAEWRINASSIEFPEDGQEFRGGSATVSRAFLVASKSTAEDSAQTKGENKSDGDKSKRKAIAVKKLKIENEKDKERVLGLALREAGFLTELSFGHVIKLEGFVEDLAENRVWLVFPWAAHGNLKDFVASADWEVPERICLIYDVAGGVEYLHDQNPPIYHGDLKSANVLVNVDYRAVITDFGSARRLVKKDPPEQPEKSKRGPQPELLLETEFCEATSTMTLTGNQFTLRWAAPELLMEDEPGMGPGLSSDIWALGWIFYEVMTNSIPFQNVKKDSVVVIHVIQGNLPSVGDHVRMALIRALYSLMIGCWNIDPSKRPTAEDCRKSMDWMPMTIPQRASNTSARSPDLLIKLGDMHLAQDDYIVASKYYTEALGICTRTADNAGKSKALWGLADVHRLQSQYSEAVPLYSEMVQICTDTGDKRRRANALWGLAEVHRSQAGYSEAVPLYSEAVQIFTEIGHQQGRANSLAGLANVHRLQCEYSEAVPLYSEAIQICTEVGNKLGRADALWGLADVHRLQGQYIQAVQLFSECLQIRIEIGDRYGRALALAYLAHVHNDQDQHEDAIRLYEQAVAILEKIGNTQDAAVVSKEAAKARQQLELKPAEAE